VKQAQDWAWSSARAHLAGRDDLLVRVAPLLDRVGRFSEFIDADTDCSAFTALRSAVSAGRPLGAEEFVVRLEQIAGRRLRKAKPGRKPSG
jgi:putative transposase